MNSLASIFFNIPIIMALNSCFFITNFSIDSINSLFVVFSLIILVSISKIISFDFSMNNS